jgi:hypothetical protein
MSHHCALLSLVYMMGFVMVFDGSHYRKKLNRLLSSVNLLSQEEVDRLQAIWAACQET